METIHTKMDNKLQKVFKKDTIIYFVSFCIITNITIFRLLVLQIQFQNNTKTG
jgi:hypothetical protein